MCLLLNVFVTHAIACGVGDGDDASYRVGLGIISSGRLSRLYVCVLSVEINSLVLVVNLCVGLAHWGCLEE